MKKYCSNALVEEVKIHLHSLWPIRYSEDLNFLGSLVLKEPMRIEKGNIKIDIKPDSYKAYIKDLLISESSLDKLSYELIKTYNKPFYKLKIDIEMLNELEYLTSPAPRECVYRAILELPREWVEEEVINKAILYKDIPLEKEVTASLESNYEYNN